MRKLPLLSKQKPPKRLDLSTTQKSNLLETNKNQCEDCIKKSVCQYTERFKGLKGEIYELDDVIDLPVKITIECEEREIRTYTF